ncbi:MAG: ABC transporter permease [Saprospiraceae bacterium]
MQNHSIRPPQLPRRFLLWFIKDELAEEVEGDLEEKYFAQLATNTKRKANWNYCYQVLQYLRPFAIRAGIFTDLNPFFMFRHHFKVSSRTLIRDKWYSLLNIGGLALGMTVALLISFWLWDELNFNKNHANYDQIAQVMRSQNGNDERFVSSYQVSALADVLREKYRQHFTSITMMRKTEERIISFNNQHFSEPGNFIDANGPALFSLEMLEGNQSGLTELNTILVAKSLARKLFGQQSALGKIITINGKVEVQIAGVFADLPRNSTFWETTYLAPIDLYFSLTRSDANAWENYNMQLYAHLQPQADLAVINALIKDELKAHIDASQAAERDPNLFLHPMAKWHLHSDFEEGKYVTSKRMKLVWMTGLIGLFVLILASINFVNLSTARSEKRTKEISVRKSMGSTRRQLFSQFMSESMIIALSAFTLAIALLFLLLPWFNDLSTKMLSIPLFNFRFWLLGLFFTIVVGGLAGSYPALYLSRLQPLQILKGRSSNALSAFFSRKILVVFQFTISIALIIGAAVIQQHIQNAEARPLGYHQAGLVMIPKQVSGLYRKHDVLRQELKKSGAVEEITTASYPLTNTRGSNTGFHWNGKSPNIDPSFNTVHVNHEYGKTINWKLIAGRDFSRAKGNDQTAVVITESAQKIMGLENAVGETLRRKDDNFGAQAFTIIGVVKDLVKDSPFKSTQPAIMFLTDSEESWLMLRLNAEIEKKTALAQIQNVFAQVAPNAPFNFSFVDAAYATKFKAELQLGQLVLFFAILAILISCLGVIGLAAYAAEQRTKEMGVRKILGANTLQLWQLLSKDFALLVAIAGSIAMPLAWYFF